MATTSFFSTGNTPSIEPGDFNTLVAGLQAQSTALEQQYQEAERANQEAQAALAASIVQAGTIEFTVQQYIESAQAAAAQAQASAEQAELSRQAAQDAIGDAFGQSYLGIKVSDPTVDNVGDPLVAGALYFNSTAQELRVYNGSTWIGGVIGASATATAALFSGDSAKVRFTLPVNPADKANTQVFVHGVYQQKSTYSLSGSDVVFSSAPPLGVDNVEVLTISTVPLGTSTGGSPSEVTPATGFTLPTTNRMQTSSHASLINGEGHLDVTTPARIPAGTTVATVADANHTPLFELPWLSVMVTDGTSYERVRGSMSATGVIKLEQQSTIVATKVILDDVWRH